MRSLAHPHTRMHQQHAQASESCSATTTQRGMLLCTLLHTRVPLSTHASVEPHIRTRACTSNTHKNRKAAVHQPHEKACCFALCCACNACVQPHISTRACTSNTRKHHKAAVHQTREEACCWALWSSRACPSTPTHAFYTTSPHAHASATHASIRKP
jgi:hypothetical protein